MRLGWFTMTGGAAGAADSLLADLAAALAADGLRLAGAVQDNSRPAADCACDMDLRLLGVDHPPIRISQSLGAGSTGCRLDPGALEQAAGLVSARLDRGGVDLVLITKFGKQESLGRGFRQAIAQALEADLPVLLHVPSEQRGEFDGFAGDFGEELAPGDLARWCRSVTGQAA